MLLCYDTNAGPAFVRAPDRANMTGQQERVLESIVRILQANEEEA
jgi:hypothetical protein